MKLSKLLGRIDELPLPELIGKVVCYKRIRAEGEVISDGEKKIAKACVEIITNHLIIWVWGEAIHIWNYKEFFEGDSAKFWAMNMHDYSFRLKEPFLNFEYIEKEIKRQMLIRKILKRWDYTKNSFKHISPILIFILKCITLALILKLIL